MRSTDQGYLKVWTGNYRTVELALAVDDAEYASHAGNCDQEVADLCNATYVREQLDKIDPAELRRELEEYSDWDCSDHEQNCQRLVWIAAGDIRDGDR